MPGDDGLKVDWVFKDEVSVGVGGKDVGAVTLQIFESGKAVCSPKGVQFLRYSVPHSF